MSLVAIVGRPNVGKSTLFNRLVGQRKAIVDATAGTTRDRHYGKTDWNGREFSVIDTGGYSVNSDDIFEDDIRRQVMLAIEEADVILFLVEVNTGITDLDQMMADILRRTSKKVLLVCNKVDNYDLIYSSHEFYSLGLGEPYCISSMSGSGTGDLMDEIVRDLPPETKNEEEELPRITIVGRPNVGKSSLLNALLREERAIVSQYAGTTRDVIEEQLLLDGVPLVLADTAGIRATDDFVEKIGVEKSRQLLADSELVICVIDGSDGLTDEDEAILEAAAGKPCVVIVNKSDLPQQVDLAQLRERFGADKVMTLSAKTLVGIEAFTAWLKSYLYGSKGTLGDGAYIQNARQECLLREALAGLQDAEVAAQDYLPYDCIVIDVRSAIDLLGEITGDTVQDEIINEIFERFCIGK